MFWAVDGLVGIYFTVRKRLPSPREVIKISLFGEGSKCDRSANVELGMGDDR